MFPPLPPATWATATSKTSPRESFRIARVLKIDRPELQGVQVRAALGDSVPLRGPNPARRISLGLRHRNRAQGLPSTLQELNTTLNRKEPHGLKT